MADMYSKEKRSKIMSNVGGKDTKYEVFVRKFLFANGFRYRKNDKHLPGSPDIVLPRHRTVIFVNGCFWHGHHNCKAAKLPETNTEFWKKKISGNIVRDRKNIEKLRREGWKVITIWQCELKNKKDRGRRMKLLINELIMYHFD